MTAITNPEMIERFRLVQLRGALKLERLGMKHSRMGNIRAKVATFLGMPKNSKIDEVIARLTEMIDKFD